jgi:BirA family transcriptional regulator, biotin operon repressor / biotin---[acetyl-CoA-carboxylase] ligase
VNLTIRLPDAFVLHAFDRLESTNDEAKRLAEAGSPAGQVVWALEQTRGRGRYGRSWQSPPGNLYASVLLRPDCAMAEVAQLSLLASLALFDALTQLGPAQPELALKWPNDVLLAGAKTAGILLEGAARADGAAAWVVIGSGVNIVSFPGDTPYPATALAESGFGMLTPATLLEAYLAALDGWLRRWRSEGFSPVREAWRGRSFNLGGPIRLRLQDGELQGRFVDLTQGGGLLLEQADGSRREIAAGDVLYGGH